MKRIFIIMILFLLMAVPLFGQGGILLLDAVDTTGASDAIVFNARTVLGIPSRHVVSCYYTDANGSISALVIALQGSVDTPGTADQSLHWVTIASHTFSAGELTAKQAIFYVSDAPTPRIRVNITTLTGVQVGTDDVYVLYSYEK